MECGLAVAMSLNVLIGLPKQLYGFLCEGTLTKERVLAVSEMFTATTCWCCTSSLKKNQTEFEI